MKTHKIKTHCPQRSFLKKKKKKIPGGSMVACFQEGVLRALPDGDLLGSHPSVTGGKAVLVVTDSKQMQS